MHIIRLAGRIVERGADITVSLLTGVSILSVLLSCAPAAQAAIPQQERDALTVLYDSSLGGSYWVNRTGWLGPPGSECNWYGVTCDATQSSVIGLTLPENGLYGGIPAKLSDLTNLEVLRLDGNHLEGNVPAELGSLQKLQVLNLSRNDLYGTIPAELGNLKQLQSLSLSYAQSVSTWGLSGGIPPELGNLTNLQALELNGNQLSGPIPAELGRLSNLQFLNLSENRLSSIPAELGNLANVQELDLSYNQLTGAIPAQLGSMQNLVYLELSTNRLGGTIPAQLRNLTRLDHIGLGHNQLSGTIPGWLGTLTNLQSLDLSYNQFEGTLPAELGSLTGLLELSLGGNRLSGNVPEWLGNLVDLMYLSLEANQLSGPIPLSLNNIKNTRYYTWDFSYNALLDPGPTVPRFRDADTQTVAPAGIEAAAQPGSSILLSWSPIAYAADSGRYEVYQSSRSGGPYTLAGSTASKGISSLLLAGLSPGTHYFVVKTVTDPHPLPGDIQQRFQQNTLTSEFSSEIAVTVGVPSINVSFSAGGAASALTMGGKATTSAGYATVSLTSGDTPYGTAVFTFSQNGAVVSEAGVPASPPTTLARIFVDYRTGTTIPGSTGNVDVYTGFALANRGNDTAAITYTLRGLDGKVIAVGNGSLAKGAHVAKFIHELADMLSSFSLPASFPTSIRFGTLELSSSQPLSVVALRLTTNQRGETLFTSTPVADMTRPLSSAPVYFPQVADGGGYTTTIILLNTSGSLETGTLYFHANDGTFLGVQSVDGSSSSFFPYSVLPGGAFVFQSNAAFNETQTGWVELTPDSGTFTPAGAGLFQYSSGGVLVTESGVPSATPTTRARIFVDTSAGHDTGLAIGNPDNIIVNIGLAAYEMDGLTPAGIGRTTLTLSGKGHEAAFVYQRISGLPAGFRGVLDIVSYSPFVALTLRSLVNERGEFLLTAFPVADMTKPAPTPVIFPQIADGDGFTTEFVLLSAGSGGAGTVNLFDDAGNPLAIGK